MKTKVIYLAGGCFWGTEHFLSLIPGVLKTEVGYANSLIDNPSYRLVCTGSTQAVETVKVTYDPERVSLSFILDLFYKTIDPTSINRQGNDQGTQYRTGIYFIDEDDKAIVQKSLLDLQNEYSKPIQIEYGRIKNFFPAEEYHQDYLLKNPGGYCHINPSLFKLAKNASDPTVNKTKD